MDTAHMFIYRGRMTITIYIFENSPCYIRYILSINFLYTFLVIFFCVPQKKIVSWDQIFQPITMYCLSFYSDK